MTDPLERAERCRKIARVIEAKALVTVAEGALKSALQAVEEVVGTQHDLTAQAIEARNQTSVLAAKLDILRGRLPWP